MILFTSPIKRVSKDYINPFSKLLSKKEIDNIEEESMKYPIFSSGSVYSGCKILFFNLLKLKNKVEKVVFNTSFDLREFLAVYDFFRFSFYEFKIEISRYKFEENKNLMKVPLPFFRSVKELLNFYSSTLNLDLKSSLNLERKLQLKLSDKRILITGDFLYSYDLPKYLIDKGFLISILNKNIIFFKSLGILPDLNINCPEIEIVPLFFHILKNKDNNNLVLESY